jgi:hypothetical protein
MWLRLLDRWEIGRVAEVLALQRTHPEQGSRREGPFVQEKQALFAEVFERLGPGGLFPEASREPSSHRALARAYVWLADEMAIHRYWFDFADRYYRRALDSWRSPTNPAYPRLLLGARGWTAPVRRYRLVRHRLGVLRGVLSLKLLGKRS